MAHGGVMIGREHETDASFTNAVFNRGGVDIKAHTQMLKHLRRAGARRQGTVAVFGDMHPAGCDDQRRSGGNIERAGAVAARAACVERVVWCFDGKGVTAHDLCAGGDLFNRFAAHAQRHQKRADLCRGRLARQNSLKGLRRFGSRKRHAAGNRCKKWF